MLHKPERIHHDAKCPFCEEGMAAPSFLNPSQLRGFLTERGKIVARSRSGVCLMHQRHLTRAVKHARFMALLPFVSIAK
jgi:small subunit ribosomal protein S18